MFKQTPANHLAGKGCKQCGIDSTGFNKTKWKLLSGNSKHFDSFKVYIIKCFNIETKEAFIKIGRTFLRLQDRFGTKGNNKRLPYSYTIVKEIIFSDAEQCWAEERNLHHKYKNYKYIPVITFGGMYECFNIEIINEFL